MSKSLDMSISPGVLIKFSLPTIIATVFMGIYSAVDGVFVARLVGENALSAVNIVMPLLMVVMAVGFMLGAGGNALVAKKMGEGRDDEARRNFSLLIVVAMIISVSISVLGGVFLQPLMYFLGADNTIIDLTIQYAMPLLIIVPFALNGIIFQQVFVTEGKPSLGLIASVIGGFVNIGLDYLFIAEFNMGIQGAAIATGIGYAVPALMGFIYFTFSRKSGLYFVKPKFDLLVIVKASTNGMSEMITMLASSVTMVLMNNILIRMSGANGVASATIILTVHGILTSVYMGYSSGIAPIISFNYGRQETSRLKKIYSISKKIIFVISVVSLALSFVLAGPLVGIYVKPGTEVYAMAVNGFKISAFGFLFMGFNSFASAMFTALNNGKVSGILSIFRTLIFVLISMLTLPMIFGVTGVWIALPVAEALSIVMTIYYFKKMKNVYKYA